MNILIINGSPHVGGNTTIALSEMVKIFDAEGVETEIVQIGNQAIIGLPEKEEHVWTHFIR